MVVEMEEKALVVRAPDGKWLKGHKGGPGVPRGTKHMVTRLWEALEHYEEETQTMVDQQVVTAWVNRAKKGDMKAVELLMAYTSGKPPQSKEDPGSEDNPIHQVHHVVWDK